MEDAPGQTAVLANDVDMDGDDLGVETATQGEHGTVACSNGTCTYRPDADYHGADSFTYTVSDARGGSATGTVAVSVRSVNDAPVASDDSALVAASGTVVLDLSADDSPGPANEDGETLPVRGIASPPSYGVATPLPDGAVRYRPPEGYSGPDWLEYEVCDDGTTAGAPDPRCTVGSVRLRVQRVAATAETDPVPNAGDTAIWVHPTDPSRSTIIGTEGGGPDGVGGLAVYDLAGTQLQYLEIGTMNNVDLGPTSRSAVPRSSSSQRAGGRAGPGASRSSASRGVPGSWSGRCSAGAPRTGTTTHGVERRPAARERRARQALHPRRAGVPYLAGLVRACELARGRIEHALAFAYDFPTAEYVFPATKSDGNAWDGVEDDLDSHPGDVPEGTRLQLDPGPRYGRDPGMGLHRRVPDDRARAPGVRDVPDRQLQPTEGHARVRGNGALERRRGRRHGAFHPAEPAEGDRARAVAGAAGTVRRSALVAAR
jgi:Bacterial Ig domain/Phytase